MNTQDYDKFVKNRWMKSSAEKCETDQILIAALGLTGEAGEVAEKLKKWLRGDYELKVQVRKEILKELGDVQFYLSTLARLLCFDTNLVMTMNIDKLNARLQRTGTMRGDGDNR